jgi:hypothetical protein
MVEAASSRARRPRAGRANAATRHGRPARSSSWSSVAGSIDFFELVDDIMDEIARQLGTRGSQPVSPMAIKLVRLSSNLRPEFARTLETRLIARLTNATNVKMNVCTECTAMRSRVEDGNWILTLGAVNTDDLRRIGARSGVKTFMEVDFTYSPTSNVVWMSAVIYRASATAAWSGATPIDPTRRWRRCCGQDSASPRAPSAPPSWSRRSTPARTTATRCRWRGADRVRRRHRRHRGRAGVTEVSREVR